MGLTKTLILTGPIHSGTSLLAKIVHENFVPMTKPLNDKSKYDYMGYENKIFHSNLLQIFYLSGIKINKNHAVEIESIPSPEIYTKKLKLIKEPLYYPEVFKAPYICFLLSLLYQTSNNFIIHIKRNKKNNIKSLMNRENYSKLHAKKILNKYKKHLKYNLQYFDNTLEVRFEKLLKNDKKEINKIKKFIEQWKEIK